MMECIMRRNFIVEWTGNFRKIRKYFMNDFKHKVGKRRERPITFHATAENFIEGCRFNDALHALPTGRILQMQKGIYHFHTHADADEHRIDSLIRGIAAIARQK